ncbi:MAG: alkaline phosphatase family protein [SAR324 cluster bacterium]|nr:alkaline phosphatase family protein [SAR324 cluster bacterium]
MQRIPRLLIIIDGMGDRPIVELGDKTPLQAADLPVLDLLAREGQCGVADPVKRGIVATTVLGTLAILGYDPLKHSIARGVIEAHGSGMKILPGDVAFRGNWATLDDTGKIVDRRAGRIREGTKELASSLSGIKIEGASVEVGAGTEHRVAVVIRGTGLEDSLIGSDPGDHFHSGIKPRLPVALKQTDQKSVRTAKILKLFEQEAGKILTRHQVNLERVSKGLFAANAILTREPGQVHAFPKIKRPSGLGLSGVCISGDDTISGISRVTGLDVCKTPAMTANLDTDLKEKFLLAGKMLSKYGVVVLHIKGCDIAAHNREAVKKKEFLEKIDAELGLFLNQWKTKLRIAVTADHATWSKEGVHVDDPVPVLLHGQGISADSVMGFDEFQASAGELGLFRMYKLWGKFFA